MNLSNNNNRGFSLIELLVILGIAGILLLVAFPNFTTMIHGQRLKAQANDTLSAIIYAKSEALKRRSTVTVCALKNSVNNQCGTSPEEWANGWLVFDDEDADGIVDQDEIIFKSRGDYKKVTSKGSITGLVFDGEGIADTSGDIEFCYDEADGNKMRRLAITPAGNPIITPHPACF